MRFSTEFRWGIAAFIAFGALTLSSAMARADVIGLYNTGVNLAPARSTNPGGLPAEAPSRPCSILRPSTPTQPMGSSRSATGSRTARSPAGTRLPTRSRSEGIDTAVNGQDAWRTQFTVTGVLPSSLSFNFAADNEVAWITLNGKTIYQGPTDGSSQYGSWTSVTADNLRYETNTLDFHVVNYAQNGGNPTGLNVQFAPIIAAFDTTSNLGQAPGPTPGAGLAGLAALALGGLYLRRRRA